MGVIFLYVVLAAQACVLVGVLGAALVIEVKDHLARKRKEQRS